ncbi:hypothetical protein CDAR_614061 [Caerostris darwini]|uniref:Uncharacterized protein n=1 Tax=Caerostris darwini TaxID=1538125 RepID=A0AAV4UND9_9ARAC|nr:hypothetical protein CDAR_614061 [Caerostris darwini]
MVHVIAHEFLNSEIFSNTCYYALLVSITVFRPLDHQGFFNNVILTPDCGWTEVPIGQEINFPRFLSGRGHRVVSQRSCVGPCKSCVDFCGPRYLLAFLLTAVRTWE